jgi:hypothetical protein
MNEHVTFHDHGYFTDGCKIGLGTMLAPAEADALQAELTTLRTRTERMERALREIARLIGCDKDGRDAQTIAREALEKGE